MALSFDGLAKEILEVMLRGHGLLETESEVPSLPSQRADVLFIPDPAQDVERRRLGLLGRMTDVACLFEPFHESPSVGDVSECMRKLLNHRHTRALKRARAAECMWLLCGGRPDDALLLLRTRAMPEWPRGFYELSPVFGLVFVVLSELPDDDDTLALRLMGAGATFAAALHALWARFGAVPRGRELYVAVVQVVLAARRGGVMLPEAVMLDVTEAEEFIRTERLEGLREGRREMLGVLARQCERRLTRSLTEAERAGLEARVDVDGAESVGDAVLDLDAAALAAWLVGG